MMSAYLKYSQCVWLYFRFASVVGFINDKKHLITKDYGDSSNNITCIKTKIK